MLPTENEKVERSKVIKLLLAKWIKSHDIKAKATLLAERYLANKIKKKV